MSDSIRTSRDVRTLRVEALARVEGEGALHLTMRDGQPVEARLDIYEPPPELIPGLIPLPAASRPGAPIPR